MSRRQRLDRELVRRELARSRQHAQDLIESNRVLVGGSVALKATTMVDRGAPVVIREPPAGNADYVSRGGHKLAGALEAFTPRGLQVRGRNCLDAGASTGGFTDVLLRAEAAHVTAVDVGYGQLAWQLRQDERVTVLDRTNIRYLEPDDLEYRPDLIVGDLSFISLKTVLPALERCAAPGADLLLMVKPQFEVGRERLGAGGVVKSAQLRVEVVIEVAQFARELGLKIRDVVASPLPGPSGNVEYFLWLYLPDPDFAALARDEASFLAGEKLQLAVENAVEGGPARA